MKKIILILLGISLFTISANSQIVINDTVNYKGHEFKDLTIKMPLNKLTFLANAKVQIKLDVYPNESACNNTNNIIGSFEFVTKFTVENNSAFYVPDIKGFIIKTFGILEEDIEVTQGFYNIQ